MNIDKGIEDDELDRQMEEAVAAGNAYSEWVAGLVQDSLRKGISTPTGHARQRAWNEHQKLRGIQLKKDKMVESFRRQIARLEQEIAKLLGTAVATSEDDDLDALFAANDKILREQQEAMELQSKTANAEQNAIFRLSPEEYMAAKNAQLRQLDTPNEGEL